MVEDEEKEEEEGKVEQGERGENLRRFHAWRAVEERASQTGPPALLVARKAGSCQPAYRRRVLYGTRERKRKRALARDI